MPRYVVCVPVSVGGVVAFVSQGTSVEGVIDCSRLADLEVVLRSSGFELIHVYADVERTFRKGGVTVTINYDGCFAEVSTSCDELSKLVSGRVRSVPYYT